MIVKVIQNGMRLENMIKDEAWALHNVKQLLGWAHTPNRRLYYLFIKYMGVPLSAVPDHVRNDHQLIRKLQRDAEEFYLSRYHLEHE